MNDLLIDVVLGARLDSDGLNAGDSLEREFSRQEGVASSSVTIASSLATRAAGESVSPFPVASRGRCAHKVPMPGSVTARPS